MAICFRHLLVLSYIKYIAKKAHYIQWYVNKEENLMINGICEKLM